MMWDVVQVSFAVVSVFAGFMAAYKFGQAKGLRDAAQIWNRSLNEVSKRSSKAEFVPEMIAVGEHAEIVRIDPEFIGGCHPHRRGLCHGCAYTGRYVLKP